MAHHVVLAIILGACSLALWTSAAKMIRSRDDAISTCFVTVSAFASTLMTVGPIMMPGSMG